MLTHALYTCVRVCVVVLGVCGCQVGGEPTDDQKEELMKKANKEGFGQSTRLVCVHVCVLMC
jgi:hypothetical protein